MAYVSPTTRSTGDLITAAIWNQDVVSNPQASAPDVFTTKGDLFVGTGADAGQRLGVGANNTVLTGDSACNVGAKWATVFSDAEGDPAAVGTAADGTSAYAARRDHVHNLATQSGSNAGFVTFPAPNSWDYVSPGAINKTNVALFFVAQRLTVVSVHARVSNAGAAGTKIGFGIYSADGNTKHIDSGAVAGDSTGIKSVTLGAAVTLNPGYYWQALTADSTAIGSATGYDAVGQTIINAGTAHYGFAANAGAAGVLPATLGAITGDLATLHSFLIKLQG